MANAFALSCSSCRARYVLPESFRQRVEGRAVFCVGCERWWVPLPASSGPQVKLVKGRPERAPIDLRPFRQAPAVTPPAAASPAPEPALDLGATARVPLATAPGGSFSLRVVIAIAGSDRRRKGVFDLGGKSFLIGRSGCHLNLPKAAIPGRAIRIRPVARGFSFEGLDGFPIPVGSMSIVSGRVEPGGGVSFRLDPYEVQLEASVTPGRPIADLEASAPPAPAPAAAAPALPRSPTRPIGPRPTMPPPPPAMAGRRPVATDLRQQVQEIAVDVRRGQPAFADRQDAMQEALDGDATITDLGALGFQASRFGNPLEGVDLRLIRADGPEKGQTFRVTKSPLVIGRTGGDLIIGDRRVSSKHAQLDVGGPRIYTLKDLASTNGTTVNDRPISVGHLADGDVVSFGGVRFTVAVKLTRS